MDRSFASLLDVEPCGKDRFVSTAHRENFKQTLFGGQVLAQALVAASKTVNNMSIHSLHAYFIRAGSSLEPIYYDVERMRDGHSISNRSVKAVQGNTTIFYLSASFHILETGFEHQIAMPADIPSPETLMQSHAASQHSPEYGEENSDDQNAASPFVIVPIPENVFTSLDTHKPEAYFWLKTATALAPEPRLHKAALAFASDLGLLATAVLPHPTSLFSPNIMAASIDHAMWFHSSTLNINDWVLCHTHSPWAGNARGFSTASIFDRNGKLLASTTQEGLIRPQEKH